MKLRHVSTVLLAFLIYVSATPNSAAEDWPMWRYDATRSAASPHSLPDDLQQLWTRGYSPRKQVWDDPLNLDLMTYDRVFEPIVMGKRLFIGFNDRDKLIAMDTESGEELWSFYAEGPVRLPPVGWRDRVFFCSDDGFLYCVAAETGELIWKFNGAPHPQHAIGNSRLISAWPARGGPVVRDDKVYFAASIWPFMGTFIYALDASTGEVVWVNDRTGSQYIKQPHSAPAFAGVAPQGAFVATENDLIVPGGRSVPAVLDRRSGELRYFELNAGGKGTGGSFVCADEGHFYVHTRLKSTRSFEIAKGVKTAFQVNQPVLHKGVVYSAQMDGDAASVRAYRNEKEIWRVEADGTGDLIRVGTKLYAAGPKEITMIEIAGDNQSAEVVGTISVEESVSVKDSVQRLIAADEKLFAVTLDGKVIAFGAKPIGKVTAESHVADLIVVPEEIELQAKKLLARIDDSGYGLWYGDADSLLVRRIADQSHFAQLAIVDSENKSFPHVRELLDGQNLSGRVTLHQSTARDFHAPQYVAHFVHIDGEIVRKADEKTIRQLFQSVRPYGGILHIDGDEELAEKIKTLDLEQAEVRHTDVGIIVTRVGSLPGAADWTHQYGDITNSVKSNDSRVKLPLGVLWFGGSSNMDVLPRHGHGPPEQVVGGRLFIQGINLLSARDVYTGRVIWKRKFDDLGTDDVYFDDTFEDSPLNPKYNQVHIPGANARGTNYVVTAERIYIVEGDTCHVLDPATGKTITEITLPADANGDVPSWGYIGVYKNVLIAGAGFANFRDRHGLSFPADEKLTTNKKGFGAKSMDRAASASLIGFDRLSGNKLWQVDANHSFWHNGIVAGDDKIFCLDKNPQQIEDAMRRRGKPNPKSYRIVALDASTGETQWEIKENIFGTWLGYSNSRSFLLQAGAQASDRLSTEAARGMHVVRGSDGSTVWRNDEQQYAGPCILHNDLIITNANSYSESAGAFSLLTGEQRMVRNPLTGELQPWKITRAYGCNNIIAAENFLTFRSGAAGFYDMQSESGTGNLGGFKSGCTSNLVVANGVLNAPDYTRTCSCSYQNQTSLALVHMPNMEMWSVSNDVASKTDQRDIRSLGVNFGAPGDRRDENGLLWLEYPAVAGESASLDIRINSDANYFQSHSSRASDSESELPWVTASGVDAITDLHISLQLKPPSTMKAGIPISKESDDAEESEKGDVGVSSSDLELVEDGSNQFVGMRFNDIFLDQTSAVRSAYIQFMCDEASSEDTTLILTAENSGNAATFQNAKHDISSRDVLSTEVSWKPKPWPAKGKALKVHRTPDLSKLIREVIKHPKWKSGNSLAILISGSGKRVAVSSKGGVKKSPRLVIDADEIAPGSERKSLDQTTCDVTMHFSSSLDDSSVRVFDVYLQGQRVLQNVKLGPGNKSVSKTLKDLSASEQMHFKFIASQGQAALSGIEIRRNK